MFTVESIFVALKRFKDQCQNQTVLVATDNSTVVAYINKQGGTHYVSPLPDQNVWDIDTLILS